MTESTTDPKQEAAKKRTAALNRAYASATNVIREKYKAEFTEQYVAEAAKLGIDYKPKPSRAEKAEADLLALLEQNPDLQERLIKDIERKIQGQQAESTPGYATAPTAADFAEPTE